MAREKKDPENVVVLNPGAQAPTSMDRKGGPTDIDCKAYDRLGQEVERLQELTNCAGWPLFFGSLLREAEEARTQLEFAEKPRDVIRLQATIALVKSQLKKLQQPVEDLNAMRTRWPLFTHEMPWKGDFDEPTGRVTLIWAGNGPAPETITPSQIGSADEPNPARPAAPDDDDGPDEDEDEGLDPAGPEPEPDDPFGDA